MKNDRIPKIAIIIAGGCGKRLSPHTLFSPKPLLKVDGIPVINRSFKALKTAQIKKVVVVLGYLGHQVKKYLSDTFSSDFEIFFSVQKELTGSAGALSQATRIIQESEEQYFLVMACDYLLPKGYLIDLINFHVSGTQEISMSLREINPNKIPQSSLVKVTDENRILYIQEKPQSWATEKNIAGSLIYIFPKKSLVFLDKVGISIRGEKELPELINLMIEYGTIAKGIIQPKLLDWESMYN